MEYNKKKNLAWTLILVPAIYLLIYSIINFFTYYGTLAKVGAVISLIGIIVWLFGDRTLNRLVA